jgi:hypothetical protein
MVIYPILLMKKAIIVIVLLFCALQYGNSQDKIITRNYDTIHCRIIRVTNRHIWFEMDMKGVKSEGKFPLNEINTYYLSGGSYMFENASASSIPFNRFRAGVKVGVGYLLGSTKTSEKLMTGLGFLPGQAKSYYKDMKADGYGGLDVIYLIRNDYGAGAKYKFFSTSASTQGFIDAQDGMNMMYTTYRELVYVNFAGATFFYQEPLRKNDKLKFNCSSSLGMAFYRDEAEYLRVYYLLTGKSIALDTSVGLEYFLSERISAATDVSAFWSIIRKIKITDGTNTQTTSLDKDNYENLSRIDFSVGLKFYLF